MTPAEVRDWIASRLDPLESFDPQRPPAHSDFDLNPGVTLESGIELKPAAVLVPLVEHDAGLTVLLTRRADTLRNHTGQIAFPGGRLDPGETPWQGALREAHEEIGLEAHRVTVAGILSTYQTRTGYDITPVVGFVQPGFRVQANPHEVADVFEVPFAFLMEPGNHERQFRDQADGMRRYFYAMSYEDRLIWGATAGMLRALYERLFGTPAASE